MKKKVIGLGIILILIASGGVIFYIFSQPPKENLSKEFKEEAVSKLLGRKAQLDEANVPTGNKEFEGKYIKFSYPAKALIYTYTDPSTASNSSKLEDFSFDIKDPKLVFNMSVVKGNGGLTDVPAVRLRDQRSYEYEKDELTVDGTDGITYFKSGQNPEKSGFFVTHGNLYTLSVTGVSDVEVEKLFDAIISTSSFLKGK